MCMYRWRHTCETASHWWRSRKWLHQRQLYTSEWSRYKRLL